MVMNEIFFFKFEWRKLVKYREVTLNLIMSVSVVATTAFASVVLNYFIVGGSIVAIVWETANQLSIRQRNQVSV